MGVMGVVASALVTMVLMGTLSPRLPGTRWHY